MSYKNIDRGIFEIMGPTGLSLVALKTAHQLHKAQTGSLYHYTLMILTTVALILCLRELWVVLGHNLDYRGLILVAVTALFLTKSK